jgi:hypothetical protein
MSSLRWKLALRNDLYVHQIKAQVCIRRRLNYDRWRSGFCVSRPGAVIASAAIRIIAPESRKLILNDLGGNIP